MEHRGTLGAVAPIQLPPPPDPDPHRDPLAKAVVAEVCERGYEAATIGGVVRRAGISREEFDRRFESLDASVLDVYERLIVDFERCVGTAFNRQGEWPTALRAAAYEAVDWMTKDPRLAVFGAAEVLKTNEEMTRVRREEVIQFCAQMIDRGREAAPDPDSIPDSASIFAVGAIAQTLTHRVQEEGAVDLPARVPEMMNRVVDIYLGPEAAAAEWTAPRP